MHFWPELSIYIQFDNSSDKYKLKKVKLVKNKKWLIKFYKWRLSMNTLFAKLVKAVVFAAIVIALPASIAVNAMSVAVKAVPSSKKTAISTSAEPITGGDLFSDDEDEKSDTKANQSESEKANKKQGDKAKNKKEGDKADHGKKVGEDKKSDKKYLEVCKHCGHESALNKIKRYAGNVIQSPMTRKVVCAWAAYTFLSYGYDCLTETKDNPGRAILDIVADPIKVVGNVFSWGGSWFDCSSYFNPDSTWNSTDGKHFLKKSTFKTNEVSVVIEKWVDCVNTTVKGAAPKCVLLDDTRTFFDSRSFVWHDLCKPVESWVEYLKSITIGAVRDKLCGCS